MPSASHHHPSRQAALPDDVTDPLLWRLGFDVARAHQLDASGRCGNLGCPDEPGPCPALRHADRAMRLARQDGPATDRSGEFTTVAPDDGSSEDVRLPRRLPGSGLRAA
ncbi:hypothetical protein [Micromonospora sagamiensis]|uniref:Uncharacterized protein n=1 Tax=Micromonospora sagamiensis TaxID=47875 RepID=A0A562WF42_9ACTN|nr:hypothetical protein [Micromonospora sagamiensis]TWJ28893.1 hypothetical protein JD81_02399 [Micromonospora sagamiensis]BCL18080.1 hypothetical protein GCM10017556_58190 [Micromonospora sagamiensis]